MRTHWMFVALLAGAATLATAQTPSPRIGIVAGMNQATVSGSGVIDPSNHAGGLFGAYAVVPLSEAWSIQTGVMLSQKGWERHESDTQDVDAAKVSYLEVPVLLRYDFAQKERVGAFLFGGAGLGFRSTCNLSSTVHSTGETQTTTCAEVKTLTNGSFAFNSFDGGIIGGAGVRLAVGSQQLVLTTQYEMGLN